MCDNICTVMIYKSQSNGNTLFERCGKLPKYIINYNTTKGNYKACAQHMLEAKHKGYFIEPINSKLIVML